MPEAMKTVCLAEGARELQEKHLRNSVIELMRLRLSTGEGEWRSIYQLPSLTRSTHTYSRVYLHCVFVGICLSVCLAFVFCFLSLFFNISVAFYISLSVSVLSCLSDCLFVYLSVYLSVWLSENMTVCRSVCLSIRLTGCLSVSLISLFLLHGCVLEHVI